MLLLPAESKLRDSNGKQDNVAHPATVEVVTNVAKGAWVQLTALDEQQERVQTKDCNQDHEQGGK